MSGVNKEILVSFTSRTLVLTNSHQFGSTQDLDSISYKSKIYMRTLQL